MCTRYQKQYESYLSKIDLGEFFVTKPDETFFIREDGSLISKQHVGTPTYKLVGEGPIFSRESGDGVNITGTFRVLRFKMP